MKDRARERNQTRWSTGTRCYLFYLHFFGIWPQQWYRVGAQELLWAATTKARRSNDIALACEERFKQQQRGISINFWLLCKCSDAKCDMDMLCRLQLCQGQVKVASLVSNVNNDPTGLHRRKLLCSHSGNFYFAYWQVDCWVGFCGDPRDATFMTDAATRCRGQRDNCCARRWSHRPAGCVASLIWRRVMTRRGTQYGNGKWTQGALHHSFATGEDCSGVVQCSEGGRA